MTYPILFGNMAAAGVGLATFESFGVVSPQTKSTTYTAYSGSNPTGPHASQFTRMTPTNSGRPGGLTYTDIVLDGDFFVCFYSQHGGDYYNALFMYADTYKDFTHTQLGNANSTDYGYQSRYGVYITPQGFDIWDGFNQPEGSGGTYGYTGLVGGMTTSGYIGIRRTSGKFYTYYSNSAPGSTGYSNMTLIHGPSSVTYTDKIRLGIFVHDASDYLEVYSPGTFLTPITPGSECNGLGVTVANGADATNVTPGTNTSMTTYSDSFLGSAGTGRQPLDYDNFTTGTYHFHTGHTFPDYWPLYFAVQVSSSTPKVLNQAQWKLHGNGAGGVDVFGSNRSITSSNFKDETLWTHLGRTNFNGGASGLSDGTVVTQSFNSAGLGYKWYMIKVVDIANSSVSDRVYPNVRGSYPGSGGPSANPNGWAMYGLRLNKV
jgi:hypothetical protein